MSLHYQADKEDLNRNAKQYVREIFDQLDSNILILPPSENFAGEDDFQDAFETLCDHTDNLSNPSTAALLAAVKEDPVVYVLIRAILGLSPTEWAHLATDNQQVKVPENYARSIDTKAANGERNFVTASNLRSERVTALLAYASEVIQDQTGFARDDVKHRYDKIDTRSGSKSLEDLVENGVSYTTLLYERYLGSPFLSYRNSISEKVGDRMEDAVEQELVSAGVPYYRTEPTEVIPGFDQAPDFLIPSKGEPDVVIEAKITGDAGTARDKVTRVQHLAQLSREQGNSDDESFEVVACIDGRGFGVREERMRALLKATDGKVFTTSMLDQLVDNTRMSHFAE
jgi:hypothetical protein